ncbi:helix-turn-helix domain-containing protein (plasmid) [Nocardia sp. CA-084685]|uniref:helix-turn-helix domain-containing protein n=1 Tax=Nocardia sp. CA-084685 TaxID=3239970 RepID=UPI003D959483
MPGVKSSSLLITPEGLRVLGRTLRQCRERASISRDRLAPKALITASTLEKWEAGERLPMLDKIKYWFDALDANDWYREKVLSLSQPALFELQQELAGSVRQVAPSTAELRQLELLPFPACYRRLPTYDVIAANTAFRRAFRGFAPASPAAARPANFIEWMLLSPLSRTIVRDWARHTHVMVNALQVLSPAVVPTDDLDTLVGSFRRSAEFHDMWLTDVTNDDIHNNDMTILDQTHNQWVPYLTNSYRAGPRSSWELFTLTPS